MRDYDNTEMLSGGEGQTETNGERRTNRAAAGAEGIRNLDEKLKVHECLHTKQEIDESSEVGAHAVGRDQ